MTKLVMGVDSSTQSCKVELRDADSGELFASGTAPHPPTQPPVSEQDPSAWWQALVEAARQVINRLPGGLLASDVAAVSVAAQCHGLVLLDEHGDVLRRAKLWNDTTASTYNDALRDKIGREEWIRHTGSLPTAAFTLGKVAWVADREPETWVRTRSILLPHDWLTRELADVAVTDRSDASGTGYFDSTTDSYLRSLIDVATAGRGPAGDDLELPVVLGPSQAAGELTPGAAAALGLTAGIPVGPGAGDQHASALGIGVGPGDVVYSLGTSGVVFTTSLEPVHDASGRVDGVADATGHWLPLVSTLNAAKVADAMCRWLGIDHAELGRLAEAAPADADRPIMAPFLDGERTPDLPHATALLAGLTGGTGRPGLALAALEGLVLGLVSGRKALKDAGVGIEGRVLAVGGASRLAALTQVLADFDGHVIHGTDVREAVARGAAIQAAALLAGREVTAVRDEWRPPVRPMAEPRAGRGQDEVFHRYQVLAGWRGMDTA